MLLPELDRTMCPRSCSAKVDAPSFVKLAGQDRTHRAEHTIDGDRARVAALHSAGQDRTSCPAASCPVLSNTDNWYMADFR